MEELKKNQFAIIVGGIVLVYVVLYFFLLRPLYHGDEGISILTEDLVIDKKHLEKYRPPKGSNKPTNIPSKALIDYHKKQKQELQNKTQEIEKFFQEKSKYLNDVFPEIAEKQKQGGSVSLAYFQAVYVNQIDNFAKSYVGGNKKLEIYKKDSSNSSFDFDSGKPRHEEIKEILNFNDAKAAIVSINTQADAQKKFWIIKYMLETLENGNLLVLNNFTAREVASDKEVFRKYAIEFSGTINYESVALLLQSILQSEKLLTEIKKVDINRDENYKVKVIDIPVAWDERPYEERKKEALDNHLKNNPISPTPVNVKIECNIWDYRKTEKK